MTGQERLRGDRLRAYVEAAKGEAANVDACSTWSAQWVVNETGREFDWPMFSSRDDVATYVAAAGGLVAVWDRLSTVAGLAPCYGDEPQVGDVGIIETSANPSDRVGGIFASGGTFCWRAENGVRIIGVAGRSFPVRTASGWERRPVVVKAWQVPCAS